MPSEPVLVTTSGVAATSGWPGQAVQPAERVDELEVEPAERGQHRVQAGRVVALRREVTVAVPQHLEVEPADDVERAESRAEVAGAGALDHVQHVQPAGVGEGRGALVRVAVERRGAAPARPAGHTGASRDDLPQRRGSPAMLLRALEVLRIVDRETLVALGEEGGDALARDRRASRPRARATRQSRGSSSAPRPAAGTGSASNATASPDRAAPGPAASGRPRRATSSPGAGGRARRRGSSRHGRRARGSAPTRAEWWPRCGRGSWVAGWRMRPRRGRSWRAEATRCPGDIGSAVSGWALDDRRAVPLGDLRRSPDPRSRRRPR